ncbi:MAG: hypothetical protein JJU36_07385 [Phycisphaeraceae bacterium]|nr:hypothetical protein [Phycisphaeraceae bacterium]
MTDYYVGWDVGSWMCSGNSRDAIHVLTIENGQLTTHGKFRGNLLSKCDGEITLTSFFKVVEMEGPQENDRVVLAVDAVFGMPVAFTDLFGPSGNVVADPVGNGAIGNPYLYRETERFVKDKCWPKKEKLPFSVIQDSIGSHATKACHVLSLIKKSLGNGWLQPPLIPSIEKFSDWNQAKTDWNSSRVHIIEVYPSASSTSSSFQKVPIPKLANMGSVGSGDLADALRCAVTAACYGQTLGWLTPGNLSIIMPNVWTPWDNSFTGKRCHLATEGWIWFPQ